MTGNAWPELRARTMYGAQGRPGNYALSPAEANRLHEHLTTRLLDHPISLSERDLASLRAAVTETADLLLEIRRIRSGRPGASALGRALSRLAPTLAQIQPCHYARYAQGLSFCVRRVRSNGKRYLVREIALLLGRSHEWLRQALRRGGSAVVTRHGAPKRAEQELFEQIMHRPHATLAIRTLSSERGLARSRPRLGRARATSRRR